MNTRDENALSTNQPIVVPKDERFICRQGFGVFDDYGVGKILD